MEDSGHRVEELAPFHAEIDQSMAMASPRQPRNTLVEQRAVFEKLRRQFNDVNNSGKFAPCLQDAAEAHDPQAQELESALHSAKKQNLEMSVRLKDVEEELGHTGSHLMHHVKSASELQAEVLDLKLRLEASSAAYARQDSENAELRAEVAGLRGEIERREGLETRWQDAEEDARAARNFAAAVEIDGHCARRARAEEEARAAEMCAATFETEVARLREGLAQATQERSRAEEQLADQRLISARMKQVADRARAQAEEAQEHNRVLAEDSEDARARAEARLRQLESEHRRVSADLARASAEGEQRRAEMGAAGEEIQRLRASSGRLTAENKAMLARLKELSEGFLPGGGFFSN